jgi:glucokinase
MRNLIGDIGGSNTRFALIEEGLTWNHFKTYRNEEFNSFEEIIETYLNDVKLTVSSAAFAAAGPVRHGSLTLTNRGWSISSEGLQQLFNFQHCSFVNDFSAIALGIKALREHDVIQVGGEKPDPFAPVGIIGPGTGLGVGGLVPGKDGGQVMVTEGGHVTLAARSDRAAEIIACLRKKFGHVSAERAISGQGIENLYWAISELAGTKNPTLKAADIGKAAMEGIDPIAKEAMEWFFTMLGSEAGDLALTYGAFGGVYIAGGIVRRYQESFLKSGFREAFEAKGRMSDYVKKIPVYLIVREHVELVGLAANLRAELTGLPWPHVW